jgi:hypothetical protein
MFGKDFLQGTMDDLAGAGIHSPTEVDPRVLGTHNPNDYGMPGKKSMTPVSRMAGVRLGGAGLATAGIGQLVDEFVLPAADRAIGTAVHHVADTIRNPDRNKMTANILGTIGGRF